MEGKDMDTAKLALHGGAPVRDGEKKWPGWPVHDESERNALLAVLESGRWFFDERVAEFEKAYAAFQGAEHCIACNSGTAAGEIILQALGIGVGDEVIVPPYTFIATASAVLRVGATPVFADLDAAWCLDADQVEAVITPRTRAIMPVHFGGRICDMDKLNAVSERHGIAIIEDACHSWGGAWKGCGTGTLGRCGFFSFQVSKNITAGEGGAIVTNDAALAARCRSLVNCGRGEAGSPWYHHVNVGTNARLTEFQAAILLCQLKRLEAQTLLRERNAAVLDHGLGAIEGLTPQRGSNRITRRAYHLYCMRIDEASFGCSRDHFVQAAQAEGLPITAGYPMPLYRQPVFGHVQNHDYSKYRCPVTEDLCYKSGMWFLHQLLLASEADMQDIIAIARKIKDNAAELRS